MSTPRHRLFRLGWPIITCLFSVLLPSLRAQVIYVNAAAPPHGDGQSWATAFDHVQDALDVAQNGREIWVAKGTYHPIKNASGQASGRYNTFYIDRPLQLYGGFAGVESSREERNWQLNPTILSGEIGYAEVPDDNAYHVVWFDGTPPGAVLDGFIIEKGFANGPGGNNYDVGGGIYINGDNSNFTNPTIRYCVIRNNYARYGGAIYVAARFSGTAKPLFSHCVIIHNYSVNGPAARHYSRRYGVCQPRYDNCTIVANRYTGVGVNSNGWSNVVEFLAPRGTSTQPFANNTLLWNYGWSSNSSGVLQYCLYDSLSYHSPGNTATAVDDPLFADTTSGNWGPGAGSPAINAGNNTFLHGEQWDLALWPRIVYERVDIGAYEYQGFVCAIQATARAELPAACGQATGRATVQIDVGQPPFTYRWSDGQTTATAVGLAAGTYYVTVSNTLGCSVQTSVNIVGSTPLNAQVSQLEPAVCGQPNGEAEVLAAGSRPPYTYQWQNGETTSRAGNLTPGLHTVTVTSQEGCTAIGEIVIKDSGAPRLNITQPQPATCGQAIGQATATASSGTPPYTYLWSDGQTTATATGLVGGLYTVTITDAKDCTASADVTITDSGAPNLNITQSQSATCGLANGQATAAADGGTPPYIFAWSNGQTTAIATGLAVGEYTVNVTDAQGCKASANVTITDSGATNLNITQSQSATCGLANGQATAAANGGTPPYTFAWSNGQTTATASGLAAGEYSVSVTDTQGCTASANIFITSTTAPSLSATQSQAASCGMANGQATATAGSGTPPYTYLWSNGQTSATATGLEIGLYTVTVTDANGCTSVASIDLSGDTSMQLTINTLAEVTCNSLNDGRLSAQVAGGTPPYRYAWSTGANTADITNLTAGDYRLTVTDANGCQTVQTASLSPGYMLLTSLNMSGENRCAGDSLVSIMVAASGGVEPYTYRWNTGEQVNRLTGRPAGTYMVTITDAQGCTNTAGAIIRAPTPLSVVLTAEDTGCTDQGSAQAEAGGGTPPYRYRWSNGQTGAVAQDLAAGAYTVTVTDAHDCSWTGTVTIDSSAFEPDLTITMTETGLMVAEPGLMYQWMDCRSGTAMAGGTEQSFQPTASGNYGVQVSRGDCSVLSDCVDFTVVAAREVGGKDTSVHLYPNPNGGRFTLELTQAATVTIHDAAGRRLWWVDYEAGRHDIILDSSVSGLCLLSVQTREGARTVRVVVARE